MVFIIKFSMTIMHLSKFNEGFFLGGGGAFIKESCGGAHKCEIMDIIQARD
jgi:hypothetical protein